MKIRALIVDDEPLARSRLRTLLADEADIEVAGECGDGLEAVAAVHDLEPDLLFLDVQMPTLDGFGVLEALDTNRLPAVVFVTAYDRYALRAFEVHALDYLLKPFDRERFQKALERARSALDRPAKLEERQKLKALLNDQAAPKKPLERILIKNSGRVFFLRAEEIDWIEAAGNYVRLHVGAEAHLLRETMNGLEARLDPGRFLRIHRSTIVNVDRIQELQAWFHGDYLVILRGGKQLTLSRGYRQKVQEHFGTAL